MTPQVYQKLKSRKINFHVDVRNAKQSTASVSRLTEDFWKLFCEVTSMVAYLRSNQWLSHRRAANENMRL